MLHIVVVGLLLSRETMGCAPIVCQSGLLQRPAVTVQSGLWVTGSVRVAAFESLRTQRLFLPFRFLLPLLPSPSLTRVDACPDSSPLTTAFRGLGFSLCCVDAACLHSTFADIFKPKDRPSGGSGASGELPIQSIHGDSSTLHSSDMTKPAQAPLGYQSKQARHSWDVVLSGDALDFSKAAHWDTRCWRAYRVQASLPWSWRLSTLAL